MDQPIPSNLKKIQTFSFGASPKAHNRKSSECEGTLNTRRTEPSSCFNIISPRETLYNDTGISSPRVQTLLKSKEEKYKSIIHRLNQEIQILGLQLKQSNEIISHFTNKLAEISKNFAMLKQITDSLRSKVSELEQDNFSVKQENKNLKIFQMNLMKKVENSENFLKSSENSLEMQKNSRSESFKENCYQDIVRTLNSKILQGIDEIIEKFKDDEEDENERVIQMKDLKGMFSEECRSIIRKSLNMT
jgi:hypothetical protein